MKKTSLQINTADILYRNRCYNVEYFIRDGAKGTIVFVHGLGGCKENFWEATRSKALDNYRLIAADNPGTGNSTYYEDDPLQVDDLVNIIARFIDSLKLNSFIMLGASMGGLITLHYPRSHLANVVGYINIEGNLMPEDCMFSSKVVSHTAEAFRENVFCQTIIDMKNNGNPGYYIIANNLQLNTNVMSYFYYSFQTVAYSATGELLQEFLDLPLAKVFIYGEKNLTLKYLPTLEAGGVPLKKIPQSDHFIFYDNPKALYEAVGEFADDLYATKKVQD